MNPVEKVLSDPNLPEHKVLNALLSNRPEDEQGWKEVALYSKADFERLASYYPFLRRLAYKQSADLAEQAQIYQKYGKSFAVINHPYSQELGQALCKRAEIGVMWTKKGLYKITLFSDQDLTKLVPRLTNRAVYSGQSVCFTSSELFFESYWDWSLFLFLALLFWSKR